MNYRVKDLGRKAQLTVAFVVLMAGSSSGAFGASLKFVPMSILLDSEPRRAALTIINSGEEKVTLQLQMMKWSQDEQGRDVYEPTKDIVFYPRIVTIPAGKQGTIRVGLDQSGPLSMEKSYRLFAQELPVRKPGEKVIRMTLRVGIPVFITPKDPRPLLSYANAGVVDGKLQVTFRNGGNAHSMIQKISVAGLDETGKEVFVKEFGGWYVLPGISRAFPVEVARDECQSAKILEIQGTAGDATVKGQFNVDATQCAQLAESSKPRRLDVEKLLPPSKP
ncbi:MAG TPA: fimbria/pilus periplasmic chaperone [Spirochaetia bacterium]|nr:fimbria/pilus periplasmic chaperone [Spirochaetia bacterium]